MKMTFALLLSTMFVAGPLFAQDQIIKQRAKELVNQNNVRQGVAPPTQAPAPQAANPANSRHQQALAKLRADLAAIKPNAAATAQQKQQLATDLLAIAEGPAKPTFASATKWAEDVSAACGEMTLPDASRARFVQELEAVLNPGKYPQARMEAIFTDVQAIFQADGTARRNAVKIADDVKVLAAEAKGK